MSAQPGMMDFSKLAKEATQELEKPVVQTPSKVAASEGGIPSPSNEQVAETLETQTSEEVIEQVETPAEVQVEDATSKTVSQDETKVEAKVEEQVLDLPDTAKVKVKIDGEVQTITVGDYKDILRKNATITQRMQTFAKSREEFNAEVQKTLQALEAREKAIQEQSSKKDPLYETILNALKGQVEPKPRDPSEIVTLGDVQKERESLEKDFQARRESDKKEFEKQLLEAAQTLQQNAKVQKERQAYFDGLDNILKADDFAPLKEVSPNFVASVFAHVQKLAPQNLEEALEYSKEYIEERSKIFKKHTVAKSQEQQAKAVKQKMESSDGTTPTIAKRELSNQEKAQKFVGKNGKLDWTAMAKDSLAKMNSMA
jgi:hypothetical protein